MIGRRPTTDDDSGFALIFVMLVTTLVVMGVGAALYVVTPNITASRQSQDTLAAQSAAQSGVDDVIAYLMSIPSCRSETRICPQALGAGSDKLIGTSRQRPSLGTDQGFSWTTAAAATTDGYIRVTSTGTSNKTKRTLVADLSLQPSILDYGYYTDYESQLPAFLSDYYPKRDIYLTNSGTYSNVDSAYGGSVPITASWAASPDTAMCGQHWYAEGTGSPGRYKNGSWTQKVTLNGKTATRTKSCDVVFTTGMVEDGKTYTRDAMYISTVNNQGPVFNQPVYTLWGYDDGVNKYTTPVPATPWRGDTNFTSSYKPVKATVDLRLPKTLGQDALAEDSCVYTGPTRVVLNGDGTATVTSPKTTTKNAASDPSCYPSSVTNGIIGYTLNYQTAGSGTVIVRNLGTKPTAGWPDNGTVATQTPGAGNEVFWYPVKGGTPDPATGAAPTSGCSSSVKYSAAVSATCAWTNVATATDATATTGWTAYTSTAKCNTSPADTDRQRFECEYSNTTGATTPPGTGYAALRTLVQNSLAAGGSCASATDATAQGNCVANAVTNALSGLTTTTRKYVATATVGTAVTGTAKTGGAAPNDDALFDYSGTLPTETPTSTPVTVKLNRQTLSNGTVTRTTPQLSLTDTYTTWAVTTQASGNYYFPDVQDVTDYNSGAANATSVTASGSSGALQPGDLYVEGKNKGKLSLVAENDVVVTGDITNPTGYSPLNDAMSIVAQGSVRNYHPMSCLDQVANDINKTTPGWCPNDITFLGSGMIDANGFTAAHPARQYVNMQPTGTRTIEAAVFALSGSFRTDNHDRGLWVGDLDVHGGIYQSQRGANGVQYSSGNYVAKSGTTLNYTYVDLQRAELPYAPPATSGNYTRLWNVVSVSAGKNPTS